MSNSGYKEKPEKYRGYNVLIEQDEDCGNPYRDWDQLSDVTFWLRNYDLDSQGKGQLGFESPKDVQAAYDRGEIVYFGWIYAYIHSGITVRLSKGNPYPCEWDSGPAGVVYVTREKAKENWPELGGRTLWLACERAAKVEIETLDQYLTGDVWGYWVWPEGESKLDGENCWGMYGYDYCQHEAWAAVDQMIEAEARREADLRQDMWDWEPSLDAWVRDRDFEHWVENPEGVQV